MTPLVRVSDTRSPPGLSRAAGDTAPHGGWGWLVRRTPSMVWETAPSRQLLWGLGNEKLPRGVCFRKAGGGRWEVGGGGARSPRVRKTMSKKRDRGSQRSSDGRRQQAQSSEGREWGAEGEPHQRGGTPQEGGPEAPPLCTHHGSASLRRGRGLLYCSSPAPGPACARHTEVPIATLSTRTGSQHTPRAEPQDEAGAR